MSVNYYALAMISSSNSSVHFTLIISTAIIRFQQYNFHIKPTKPLVIHSVQDEVSVALENLMTDKISQDNNWRLGWWNLWSFLDYISCLK